MEVKSGKMMKSLDFFFQNYNKRCKSENFLFWPNFIQYSQYVLFLRFLRSPLITHLIIVESGKRNDCFEKMSENIPEVNLDSKIGRNPVQACTR